MTVLPEYQDERPARCLVCSQRITVPNEPGSWVCGECAENGLEPKEGLDYIDEEDDGDVTT